MLPPRANLYRYIQAGADMVVYSGGKGIRGPRAAGFSSGAPTSSKPQPPKPTQPSFWDAA